MDDSKLSGSIYVFNTYCIEDHESKSQTWEETWFTKLYSPKWQTLARGARQLVVQLALETIFIDGLYVFSFTPTTNIGASADGADITTFFAPPYKNILYIKTNPYAVHTPPKNKVKQKSRNLAILKRSSMPSSELMPCPLS